MDTETQATDLDPSRRPGVPRLRPAKRWPNAVWPIPHQQGTPSAHRQGKPVPPVFGTSLPLRGLSGVIRRYAYRFGDDRPARWILLLVGDRVEVWGHRVGRLLAWVFARTGAKRARSTVRRHAIA